MELVVKEEERHRSIGKLLLNRAYELAGEQECALIEVCCNMSRTRAHRFYEREGMIKSHFKLTKDLQ